MENTKVIYLPSAFPFYTWGFLLLIAVTCYLVHKNSAVRSYAIKLLERTQTLLDPHMAWKNAVNFIKYVMGRRLLLIAIVVVGSLIIGILYTTINLITSFFTTPLATKQQMDQSMEKMADIKKQTEKMAETMPTILVVQEEILRVTKESHNKHMSKIQQQQKKTTQSLKATIRDGFSALWANLTAIPEPASGTKFHLESMQQWITTSNMEAVDKNHQAIRDAQETESEQQRISLRVLMKDLNIESEIKGPYDKFKSGLSIFFTLNQLSCSQAPGPEGYAIFPDYTNEKVPSVSPSKILDMIMGSCPIEDPFIIKINRDVLRDPGLSGILTSYELYKQRIHEYNHDRALREKEREERPGSRGAHPNEQSTPSGRPNKGTPDKQKSVAVYDQSPIENKTRSYIPRPITKLSLKELFTRLKEYNMVIPSEQGRSLRTPNCCSAAVIKQLITILIRTRVFGEKDPSY